MTTSPMGPLSRIGKRLGKQAEGVGLKLRSFNAAPDLNDENGPHHAQAIFTLEENFTPEPPKDDEWEKFQEDQAAHEAAEREEKAKEGLSDLMKELGENLNDPRKGFL